MSDEEEEEERAYARRGDPWTSWEAANAVGHMRESQQAVFGAVEDWGPVCDMTLVDRYIAEGRLPRQEPSGIRTRRKELTKKGLLVDTGDFVRGRTNRRMILWDLASRHEGGQEPQPVQSQPPTPPGQVELGI